MKRIGRVFDRITSFENLYTASGKALRGKKTTPQAAAWWCDLEPEIIRLEEDLRSGAYRPGPYRTFTIYEPKQRRIAAVEIRDRVVHHAICHVIEPLLDRRMIFDSYACRTGKGAHAAVQRAQHYARHFSFALKCDIRKYFETIDHAALKRILSRKIKDAALLRLLDIIIDHPVPGHAPGTGLPIGALTSQLFANLYLDKLDHYLKEDVRVKGYLRYMDDFLLFAASKAQLRQWLQVVRAFTDDRLKLELKDEASRLAPVSQGVPFLGFRIFPGLIRLDRRHLVRFRRNVRMREQAYANGDIDEAELSRSVNSLIAHIAHANTHKMRQSFFTHTDTGH